MRKSEIMLSVDLVSYVRCFSGLCNQMISSVYMCGDMETWTTCRHTCVYTHIAGKTEEADVSDNPHMKIFPSKLILMLLTSQRSHLHIVPHQDPYAKKWDKPSYQGRWAICFFSFSVVF